MTKRSTVRGAPFFQAGMCLLGLFTVSQQLLGTAQAQTFGARKLQESIPRGARLPPSDQKWSTGYAAPSWRELGSYGDHYYPNDGYYYDDYYDDEYYDDANGDPQTCIAVPTTEKSCCVCECCHTIGPSYPLDPPTPTGKESSSSDSGKGHHMAKGNKGGKGRQLSNYPPDETESRCYCTCEEDCYVPPPTPLPSSSSPAPTPLFSSSPPPKTPPPYHPDTSKPPSKKPNGSMKEKGSHKKPSKQSMGKKSQKETSPRTSEGDETNETDEKSGTGSSPLPPNSSSYSRRNFKFPWIILIVVGGCGSLYTLHLLNRRRHGLHNRSIDDTGTRASWSV